MDCRDGIAQRDIGADRRFARFSVDVPEATISLGDRGIPGFFGERAALTVARNPRVDDAGVLFLYLLRPQAPALHRAGAEVFHYHIRFGQQFKRQLAPALRLEVERDAFFISGKGVVPQ